LARGIKSTREKIKANEKKGENYQKRGKKIETQENNEWVNPKLGSRMNPK